jgi:hypothetical protein
MTLYKTSSTNEKPKILPSDKFAKAVKFLQGSIFDEKLEDE